MINWFKGCDKIKSIIKSIGFSFLVIAMTACGSDNIFFDLEQRDVATEATIAIERGEPDKAIKLCLAEFGSEFSGIISDLEQGNTSMAIAQSLLTGRLSEIESSGIIDDAYNLASVLSTAYAKKAGVDALDVVLTLIETTDTNNEPIEQLADNLENDAAGSNLSSLENSVIVLNAIGTTNFRDIENFKLAIYQVAYLTLFTKNLPDISDITVAEALDILDFLESAINSGNQTSIENGDNADESLDVIQAIYDDIGILPTDTDSQKEAKVQSFLDGMNIQP